MAERSISEMSSDTEENGHCQNKRVRLSSDSHTEATNGNHKNSMETESDMESQSSSHDASHSESLNGHCGQPNLPLVNPVLWVQKQIAAGVNPMCVLVNILPSSVTLPEGLSDLTLWRIVVEILSDVPKRSKLPHINTLHDAATLLKSCRNIVIVTGAGISVSCGIPDFRSKDGIYARLQVDYPDLPNPQAMFDIQYFSVNPKPFFKFAAEIWPGQYTPSPSHFFIKAIEERGALLRNYTQNIDTLEHVCGIRNVIQCHGSFATATCRVCSNRVESHVIKEEVMSQTIPRCKKCPEPTANSILKPDIVFFGEGLPAEFHSAIEEDRMKVDLVIVMGSSLKVKPVAHIPNLVPPDIPQILINREPLPQLNFDIELLGDCDVVVSELCRRLQWALPCPLEPETPHTPVPPSRYLFRGAEVEEAAASCGESISEPESECQSVATTEGEDDSESYLAQMRYAIGSHPFSENPGPSRVVSDWETASNTSVAPQVGDSREPSLENISIGSCDDIDPVEEMEESGPSGAGQGSQGSSGEGGGGPSGMGGGGGGTSGENMSV